MIFVSGANKYNKCCCPRKKSQEFKKKETKYYMIIMVVNRKLLQYSNAHVNIVRNTLMMR